MTYHISLLIFFKKKIPQQCAGESPSICDKIHVRFEFELKCDKNDIWIRFHTYPIQIHLYLVQSKTIVYVLTCDEICSSKQDNRMCPVLHDQVQ
jgi:hypothetical protein